MALPAADPAAVVVVTENPESPIETMDVLLQSAFMVVFLNSVFTANVVLNVCIVVGTVLMVTGNLTAPKKVDVLAPTGCEKVDAPIVVFGPTIGLNVCLKDF